MQNKKYSSTISCLQEILRADGLRGFYRGASSIFLFNPIRSSVNIVAFSWLKKHIKTENHFFKGFVAGSITGGTLTILTCPVEMVKCAMQVPNSYHSTYFCAYTIYKKFGLSGLYRGLYSTALRDSVGFGIFFGVYEFTKGKIHEYNFKFTWWGWLLCGSISGICSWTSVLPIDCVKTNFQLSKTYKSYYCTFNDIVKATGYKGLWAGYLSCIIRTFLASGVGFFCYECVKSHLPKVMPV